MRSRFAGAASFTFGFLVLLLTAHGAAAQTGRPALPAHLTPVREALVNDQDPVVAVRDGYFSTLGCVDYPEDGHGMGLMAYKPGGMGVHFLNPALIGPQLDPLKPQILVYEPVGDRLQLVAAEWWKENPSGLMHSTNPTIKCQDGPYSFHEKATKMVDHK